MNFYNTYQITNNIMLEVAEYFLNESKEVLWMSKLNYRTGEAINLTSIIAYSPQNNAEGFFDWDENYFYIILSDSEKQHIIEIIDLNKKEKITSEEEQERLFIEYQKRKQRARN